MDFFKSIIGFFSAPFVKKQPVRALPPPPPLVKPEPSALMLPVESQKLLKAIENQQLKELQDSIFLLSVNINALLQSHKNEQEFLVHIATLHEELLYQLDQGKVVMIKRSGGTAPISHEDEDAELMDVAIHKKNLN